MSPVNSLWFKWKSLKLPWRKSFLVGSDLAGNTFWEFKETLNSVRYRRIVKYNPKTHYADVKVSPQWHQWLRYVRPDPPSIAEQQHEVIRQQQMKHLAKLADERWASKPSFLDKPQEQHPGPATRTHDKTYHDAQQTHAGPEDTGGVKSAVGTESELDAQGKKKKSPWSRETGGPSENWQPESWSPAASKR